MPTPLPTDGDVDRSVPHGEEAALTVRGLARAASILEAASGRAPTAPCPPTRRRPAA